MNFEISPFWNFRPI